MKKKSKEIKYFENIEDYGDDQDDRILTRKEKEALFKSSMNRIKNFLNELENEDLSLFNDDGSDKKI